jgi:hypothetical protein
VTDRSECTRAVEAMQAMNPDSLLHRMQIEVLEASPERLMGTMPVAGNTLACYEVVITDDHDKRICTCRITCLLREAAPGA